MNFLKARRLQAFPPQVRMEACHSRNTRSKILMRRRTAVTVRHRGRSTLAIRSRQLTLDILRRNRSRHMLAIRKLRRSTRKDGHSSSTPKSPQDGPQLLNQRSNSQLDMDGAARQPQCHSSSRMPDKHLTEGALMEVEQETYMTNLAAYLFLFFRYISFQICLNSNIFCTFSIVVKQTEPVLISKSLNRKHWKIGRPRTKQKKLDRLKWKTLSSRLVSIISRK